MTTRQVSMRQISKAVIAATAFGLIAACATVTPYQPIGNNGGFSDQRLDDGRYRVTAEGNSLTDRATVENYVLYRAAEITLREGGDYFIVLDSNTEAMRRFITTGTSFGRGFGRRGFFYGRGYHKGFGGFGTTHATTRERRSYTIGAIIDIGEGPKPSSSAAYDARSIIDNLNPTLTRPTRS